MKGARILGLDLINHYHVVSRVVDRRWVMGDREKRVFRDILRRVGEFCGIECVTFCLMGNHFHLLVAVGDGAHESFAAAVREGRMDEEVGRRVGVLYGREAREALRAELAGLRGQGLHDEAWEQVAPLVARMNRLAVFVRELKWRFTSWYNGENGRVGTLWESRYRSVLIEGCGEALAATAAYIDLNPIRAGLVADPKDYCYCGYAEALGGDVAARNGLRKVVGMADGTIDGKDVLSRYRLLLFGRGQQRRDERGAVVRRGFSQGAVDETERREGALSRPELLRCRIRYLTEGAAVGRREFLERLMEGRPGFFPESRKAAGQPMRGGDWNGLWSLRNLGHAVAVAAKET